MGRQTVMSLRLRHVTNDDLPLIEQWLHADQVRSTWGDPDANLRLLNEPPASGNWRAIIEADGRKVGIVLWQHPTRQELDVAGLADIPTSVIDIDIMIAELRGKYAGDVEASAILDQLAGEPEMHRRHSDFYAYESFIARRALGQSHPEMTEALEQGAPADGLTPAAELCRWRRPWRHQPGHWTPMALACKCLRPRKPPAVGA